ncbi:MAG: amidohydrolase [Acidobacteriia bacterium]|nr:amidohydrolase [Terriglobia bacterium]
MSGKAVILLTRGALLVLVSTFMIACKPFPRAERIFVNGHVVTMNDSLPETEAFAVGNGKIVAVGKTGDMRRAFSDAEQINLRGRTVMPGIIESHVHLFSLGKSFIELNVEGITTPDEVVQKVKDRAAQSAAGEWITGWGWDEGAWAKAYPNNEKLSLAAPNNPVWLSGLHGFAGWANAKAMEIAGITGNTPNPPNGEILKDPKTGRPTGILKNDAQALLTRHIPPLSPALMEKPFTLAGEECLKYGLTTVHDANVSKPMLAALMSLANKKQLKTRVYVMLDATDRELIEPFLQHGPYFDANATLTIRCLKIFADGALGSRGAALFEPYSDAPETRGQLTTSQEEIYKLTSRALKAGLQVAVHAIGDRANRVTLDAYEAALKEAPGAKDPRLRIEHAQVIALQDIPRFTRLGIIASMQPPHCTSDMAWAENRVGTERIKGAYAWRAFLDAGVHVPLNSDFPGETPNPFWGMYAAETRQSPDGKPEGGWHAEQCLTRKEILRAYTVESAYAGFEEEIKGQIAPGMLADFIVLSDDILTIPPRALLSLEVERTYIGGNMAYIRR